MSSRHVLLCLDEGHSPSDHAVVSRNWAGIIQEMTNAGWKVSVLTLRTGLSTGYSFGGPELDVTNLGWTGLRWLPTIRRLRREIHALHPNVIHAHEVLPALLCGWAARGCSIPLIYHRHHSQGGIRLRFASQLAARLATLVLCVSEAVALVARQSDHTPEAKIAIAHNGVLVPHCGQNEVRSLRERIGLNPETLVVGVVARLRPEKGVDVAIDAMTQLRSQQSIRLIVVGSGPEEVSLRLQALRRNSPVMFIGHVDDPSPFHCLFDVLVVPSLREPFGLVAAEGMAYRRPIIASAVEGLVEVVGDAGLLIPAGDSQRLADAISTVIASPQLASQLGERGHQRYLSRFTLREMVATWTRCYESLL